MDWSKTRADRPLEARELARLGREGLDHAHAGDVLLDVGGQLGDALLDLLQRRPRAAPVAGGDEHDERHRRAATSAASPGCSANIAAAASTMVSALWVMKISP